MTPLAEHAVQVRTVGRRGTVTINGHDVSGLTRVVDVSFTGGELPVVTVGLLATATGMDLEAAHVAVTPATRELLVRLGWTPPSGGLAEGWTRAPDGTLLYDDEATGR